MNVSRCQFFLIAEFSESNLLHTHFHVWHHFVRLALCCHLSHSNKMWWNTGGTVQPLLLYQHASTSGAMGEYNNIGDITLGAVQNIFSTEICFWLHLYISVTKKERIDKMDKLRWICRIKISRRTKKLDYRFLSFISMLIQCMLLRLQ